MGLFFVVQKGDPGVPVERKITTGSVYFIFVKNSIDFESDIIIL